ncbi:MAG: hypothetical protein K5931_07395 [Lachnospiraceae bacterium]|nr:hypothetical protein [Lachnospiraceae bacterium]
MKLIFVLALTLIAAVLLIIKKEYRKVIFLSYAALMCCFNLIYDLKLSSTIVPFYRPTNQHFYQKEFLEKGEYPDSFLQVLLKDKNVYMKNDRYTIDEAKAEGKDYLYAYYHVVNMVNFADFAGAKVIQDESMNSYFLPKEKIASDFELLGYANDMFRYSFIMNDFLEELGNYFTYYWYYSDYLKEIYAYLNVEKDSKGEDISTAKDLVIWWDSSKDVEEENIYVMTKTYYEENIANGSLYQ